ncbi:CFEM domain-containing protein [Purpureocillium lavendulum]|uniref:CFEM domain-containing protein n=1 Tax=Purpureocillium lavendulum TaxID=1247861 RepID=A0AB34FJ74_9HYPO|nr:CFEM domain-containing protein [Purpureocillium lavendulum]
MPALEAVYCGLLWTYRRADEPMIDRQQAHRRRPFSTWVKRLTNFKSSSDGDRPKRHTKMKRGKLNNPYPQSGHVSSGHHHANGYANANGRENESSYSFVTAQTSSVVSTDDAARDSADADDHVPTTAGGRSMANTVSTENEGQRSIIAPSSLAGTSRTVGGGMDSRRGGDSTFSSPAPSVRSLTTTLTTIQSLAPHNGPQASVPAQHSNTQSIHFSQPFPTTSPASAIPAHLAPTPTGHPTTYSAATANGLLTDNASILTLASSSKRRRRRSMDTDASVRALAPSSLWGGSRESLPLSVLSASVDPAASSTTPGLHGSSSRIGAERTSIYSATGVAPTLQGERTSVYAKQGDGASVRSGLLGHGRPDSISGANAIATSPLASPQEEPGERHADDKEDERLAPKEE